MLVVAYAYFVAAMAAYFSYLLLFLLLVPLLFAALVQKFNYINSLLLFVSATVSFFHAQYNINSYHQQLLPHALENKTFELSGRISSIVFKRRDASIGFDFKTDHNNKAVLANKNLRLRWYRQQNSANLNLKQGQELKIRVKLKRPRGFANGAGFNYQTYLQAQNIHAVGYVRAASIKNQQFSWRQKWFDKILNTQKNSASVTNALLLALVMGETVALAQADRALFVDTGTAHLLAISGLHIGFVAWLSWWVVKLILFALRAYNWQKRAYLTILVPLLCSFGCAFLYAYLAGFSLPTKRALIMLACLYVAILLAKRQMLLTGFATGLVLVLLQQPNALLSIGFYLSFGAVLWIILLLHLLPQRQRAWQKTLVVQLTLPAVLSPLLQYAFGSSAGLAALVNVVLVPLIGFIVLPLAFLYTLVLCIFAYKLTFVYTILDAIFVNLLLLFNKLLDISWLQPIHIAQTGSMLALLAVAICCLLLFYWLQPKLAYFGLILAILLLFAPQKAIEHGEFVVDVLDVGQGTAVLIRTKNHTFLYDSGAAYASGFSMAEAVIKPFLRKNNIRQLDVLVASHNDNDHVGGLPFLAQNIKINKILMGQEIVDNIDLPSWQKIEYAICQQGQKWQFDGVSFTVLWPQAIKSQAFMRKNNNHSCVISIISNSQSLLLVGDIEKKVEQKLLRAKLISNHHALLVPHHGSRTSSSEQFIAQVKPQYALVSAAYKNHYNHPHPQIVQRYQQQAASVLNTAFCGRITWSYQQQKWLCFRRQQNWHYLPNLVEGKK